MEEADRGLVQRLRAGDEAALEEAFALHRKKLYGFLLRLSGRRDVAEDLLQDTFVKLARNATGLREDTELSAWLFTVARNAYRSHRRWAVLDVSRVFAFAANARDLATENPEVDSDTKRSLVRIEKEVAKLPLPQREVLLLVTIEGLDTKAVATMLSLTEDNVRQRLHRARATLKSALGDPQ